jgi:hypothetical protein
MKASKRVLLGIAAFLLASSLCHAQELVLPKVKGLTEDTYNMLSGIWDVRRPGGEFPTNMEEQFSWGSAKYETYFSVLIDLGAQHPFLKQGFNWFKIVSIERLTDSAFKLECRVIDGHVRSGYVLVRLEKELLRIEEHFSPKGIDVFSVQTSIGLERKSGPQSTTQKNR